MASRDGYDTRPPLGPVGAGGLETEYRFLRPLGRGAEGEVWLAEDLRRDGRLVAWKRLPPSGGEEPEEFRRRLGLRHPVLVPVLDSGVLPAGTGRWFTSAYFPGLPLDRLPEPLEPVLLEAIVRRILEGLAALNDADLRHGDVKPAHLLWRTDAGLDVRLIDLGHAAALAGGTARRVGTPPYAGPELWSDPPRPTRSTDLYALAMCALERLRGAPVIAGRDLRAWRRWHERGDRAAAIAERTVDASPSLLDSIAACLAPDPADRPRDAAALIARLRPLPGPPVEPTNEGATEPPLVGRREWLAEAMRALVADTGPAALLVAGARGSGRSRILRAISGRVRALGGIAVIDAFGTPRSEWDPIPTRALSALSQSSPLRVFLVDDVSPAGEERLARAWARLRSLAGAPAVRLVAAIDSGIPERERALLAQRLAEVAGPVRECALPGLTRRDFAELARELGIAASAASRSWRESGGVPGSLVAATAPALPDFDAARSALGEPLASWLAALPAPVPFEVLSRATGLAAAEIERRIAASAPLAPAIVGEGPRRVLPWPAPDFGSPVDGAPLAAEWRDADGETGRWAALVLDGRRPPPGEDAQWRQAVAAARRRDDSFALGALAGLASDPVDAEWLGAEAGARGGDRSALGREPPADPDALPELAAASAAFILERSRGAAAALPFALRRARLAEGNERAEARLAAARLAQDAGQSALVDELLGERFDENALSPAPLLELGALAFRRGDLAGAERIFRLALSRGRRGVDPSAVVGALSGLSGLARARGDLEGAASRIEAAIRFARRAGLEAQRPELALNQGAILHSLRRTDAALAAYRRAERWIAGRPDGGRHAHALLGIGTVLRDRGDLLAALVELRRAVRRAREADLRPLLAMALGNLGDVELLAGLPLSAAAHRRELLAIAGEAGEPSLLRQARIAAAAAAIAAGDLEEAGGLLDAASESGAGGPRLEAWESAVRADLLDLRGTRDAALRERGGALRAALRSGRAYGAAAALRGIARSVAARGDRERARRLIDRGLELARSDPCPPLSRIPLELERIRIEEGPGDLPSSARARAVRLAREARRFSLAEEFLIAAELAGEDLPGELAELRRHRRASLERRYGPAGARTLALRRGLRGAAELEGRGTLLPAVPVRAREESAGDTLPERLEELRREARATRAICFIASGRQWRPIARAGGPGPIPDTAHLPADPEWRGENGAWNGWVPFSADGRAALWLSGSGEPPSSVDLESLQLSVRVARVRVELDQARDRARRLGEQVRRLREESVAQRAQVETRVLTQRLDAFEPAPAVGGSRSPWLVRSPAMRSLVAQLPAWGRSDLPILLWGESGAGKTELLRRLAESSAAATVSENCAALPEALLEAELFGYVPGAFTGAERETPGLLERCAGGTLVLDHIDELPVTLQAKLLHVLDGGRFRPLGGGEERQVDFRLIATVRDEPAKLVAEGRLRRELYFRLQGIEARVPPLRERREEIAPLLEIYLDLAARTLVRAPPAISPPALEELEGAPWPGNIRELVNLCQRWMIEGRSVVRPEDLVRPEAGSPLPVAEPSWQGADWRSETDRFHRGLLVDALARFEGNQTQTARALGISRRHLQNLLNQHGLRGD